MWEGRELLGTEVDGESEVRKYLGVPNPNIRATNQHPHLQFQKHQPASQSEPTQKQTNIHTPFPTKPPIPVPRFKYTYPTRPPTQSLPSSSNPLIPVQDSTP
ncbi:hypothetical protein IQ07DRAFT_433308 [Pyrenochaeta sp. DS3sAY3a]|nr:hypothetical protein IQ07DRAFT_433308 [Pyrenochaeta sp. DS3sAY3a]